MSSVGPVQGIAKPLPVSKGAAAEDGEGGTQYDGTTAGQTAGGYIGTPSTGYNINFLMLHPSAVLKVMKHVLPRIFTPDINQSADAWKFDYRAYWDAFVYENKAKGVYLHRAATAL